MYEELKAILVEDLRLDEQAVRPTAGRGEVGLDSLAIVELSMLLSRRLQIEISDDELLELGTVADISRLMEQRSRS